MEIISENIQTAAIMHSQLAELWTSQKPVFLWSNRYRRPIWANREGLYLWGQKSLKDLAAKSDCFTLTTRQLENVARHLPADGHSLECLRFYIHGRDINLAYQCHWMELVGERFIMAEGLCKINVLRKKQDDISAIAYKNALCLIDGLQETSIIALSPNGELLLSTHSALHLMNHSIQKEDEISVSAVHMDELAILARYAMDNVTSTLTLGDKLSAQLQIIPLNTKRAPLILVQLRKIIADTGANIANQSNCIMDREKTEAYKNSSANPNEEVNKITTVQNKHQINEHEEKSTGTDGWLSSKNNSGYITANTGNIFPFTGVPLRIHNEPTKTEARNCFALREIAQVLGVRIEGETVDDYNEKVGPPTVYYDRPGPQIDEAINLLNKVSNGILIYRDDKPIYANRAFLDMLGHESITEIFQTTFITDLVSSITNNRQLDKTDDPEQCQNSITKGLVPGITARLQSIVWEQQQAMLLNLHQDMNKIRPNNNNLSNDEEDIKNRQIIPRVKQNETKVTNRENDSSAILEIAADGIIIADAYGRITSIDDRAKDLLSCNTENHLGQKLETIFPADSQSVIANYLEMAGGQEPSSKYIEYKLKAQRKDSKELFLQLRIGMIDTGPTRRYFAILQNNASSNSYEDKLIKERDIAKMANDYKSKFLAKISHEIRTPLNCIIGFSEIITEEQFNGIENERYRNYIRDIQASGKHLLHLVNDLLDLSKIEAGKIDLDITEININEIVLHSINLLQPEAIRRKIIVRQDLSRNLPLVLADQRSVHQILLNILSNAVKFNKSGGQVLISTSTTDENEVSINIHDTGMGMTPQQLEIALKEFRQAHETENQTTAGTGLGLPIAKALAEANKAHLSISSTSKNGTLARIIFPYRQVIVE